MGQSTDKKEHAVERAGKIYKRLSEAARMNERCPKQSELAERFSCSTGAIQNSFNFLKANGMIEVIETRPRLIIHIVRTGKTTI